MPDSMPTAKARATRVALAVLAGALGTALLGGALWLVYDARQPEPARQTEIEPAEETTGTTETSPSGEASPTTDSAVGTGSPEASATPGATPSPKTRPAGPRMIAYRMKGRLWVAREDGSRPTSVAPAATTYAVSPDGSRLAVIPDPPRSAGRVHVYSLRGGLRMGGRGAYPGFLSWSPDANRIAYTAGTMTDSSVRIMRFDGTVDGPAVSPGARPQFSSDGRYLAYRQSGEPDTGEQIRILRLSTGQSIDVPSARSSMSFGFSPGGDMYFTRPGATRGAWEIWRSKPPYRSSAKFGSITVSAPAYTLCDVSVSPDGRYLLTGARGDDHYCRVWVMDTSNGRATVFQTRRDATPYGWTSDGRALFFEGNTYQGESSSLMSAKPDGSSRRVVVEGAAP